MRDYKIVLQSGDSMYKNMWSVKKKKRDQES